MGALPIAMRLWRWKSLTEHQRDSCVCSLGVMRQASQLKQATFQYVSF